MISEKQAIEWDAIVPIISMFTVWSGSPELSWFKKAWKGLCSAGLTAYPNDEERHWIYARAITLGIMYGEYCHLEWDEHCDAESLISELYWNEDIKRSRIGNMVERHFDLEESEDQKLFYIMVLDLVGDVRLEVYDALIREFGDAIMLYVGLFLSREVGNDQDKLEERIDDVFDASHFPKGRDEAFQYVVSASMLGVDT